LAIESLFLSDNYLIFAPSLKLDLKGMEQIIGRKKEIELLTEYYHSGKAEFVAVYGRRRIGKTYLVRNLFRDKFAFDMSGSIEAPAEAQLSNFGFALREYGDFEVLLQHEYQEQDK
jgi:uncharacterized protein